MLKGFPGGGGSGACSGGSVADNRKSSSFEGFNLVWAPPVEQERVSGVENNGLRSAELIHRDSLGIGPKEKVTSLKFAERESERGASVSGICVTF